MFFFSDWCHCGLIQLTSVISAAEAAADATEQAKKLIKLGVICSSFVNLVC